MFGKSELKVYIRILLWHFGSVCFASVVFLWFLKQKASHVYLYLDHSIIASDYNLSIMPQHSLILLKNISHFEFQHSLVGKQTTNIEFRTRLDRMCSLLLKVMFSVTSNLF